MPLDWTFTFSANDLPGTYIPNLNLLRTNAQAVDAEVVAARGTADDLSAALAAKASVVHQHDAADITSGTLDPARVGAGTPGTGVWLRGDGAWASLPPAEVAWGAITGDLGSQTDLQAALDGKAAAAHSHMLADIAASGAAAGQIPSWNGTEWVPVSPASAGAVAWGSVVGTLADQIDLQDALDGKSPAVHSHAPSDITGFGNVGGYLRSSGTAWERVQGVGWNDLTGVPTTFTPSAHSHDATNIVSGIFALARIPSLPASQITSGTFSTARLGSGTANNTVWLRGDGVWATLPSTAAPSWGSISGVLSDQTDLQAALNERQPLDGDLTALAALSTTGFAKRTAAATWSAGPLSAADIPFLDASKITTGSFALARLGTGTANSSSWLRGDGTWQSLPVPVWGSISGVLSDQTDLGAALNAKAGLGANTFTDVQTAPDFVSTSDVRLKADVVDLHPPGLLRPVSYTRIDDGEHEIGFIAQEVRELYPSAVHVDSDGYLSVAYARLVPAVAAELAQLRQIVSAQAALIDDLRSRVSILESR